MFTSYPTYNPYRALKLSTPHLKGEDVYALQTALIEAGFKLPQFGADGDLGKETSDAIGEAQKRYGLVADKIAGPATQTALVNELGTAARKKYDVAVGAIYGQVHTESGFVLGNYSPIRSDDTYDAGPCQRNTKYTDPHDGFDTAKSLDALAAQIREYYDKFEGVKDDRRRWALAQGSWNAPAYASYIAKEEGATHVRTGDTLRPSTAARATLEAYIDSVSAYLQV